MPFVKRKPRFIGMTDSATGEKFGDIEELVSRDSYGKAGMARIYLDGPDVLHHHAAGTEIYIVEKGEGEIFYRDGIFPFRCGDRIVIHHHELHAARPKPGTLLVFLCVSLPAFDPTDVYVHEKGRDW